MYASLLGISCALHLDGFDQPAARFALRSLMQSSFELDAFIPAIDSPSRSRVYMKAIEMN